MNRITRQERKERGPSSRQPGDQFPFQNYLYKEKNVFLCMYSYSNELNL